MASNAAIRREKFGRSRATRHQICSNFESTIMTTAGGLENDGCLWDAVCQVARSSFPRSFGGYLYSEKLRARIVAMQDVTTRRMAGTVFIRGVAFFRLFAARQVGYIFMRMSSGEWNMYPGAVMGFRYG